MTRAVGRERMVMRISEAERIQGPEISTKRDMFGAAHMVQSHTNLKCKMLLLFQNAQWKRTTTPYCKSKMRGIPH